MKSPQDSRDATMVGRRTDGATVRRPLSPHLQVYDMLQMTSALSISHRITGVLWSVALVFLVWWLVALAAGEEAFATVQWFLSSWLGLLLLVGIVGVVWFHTLLGVRHLAWDMGYGFAIPTTYVTGRLVVVATVALTALTTILGLVFWA
jgi:succinate dehydrogenase / fumarate reductase cytochrome b subunit